MQLSRYAWARRAVRAFAVVVAAGLVATATGGVALAQQKISFGTDWKAQAEHGGFYQGVAAGIYAKYGLDVEIRQGGPQVNHAQLLAAGVIDFSMTPNTSYALNFLKNDIPVVTVAAIFQKDPQVLIAHAGQGNDSIAAMKGKPILISGDTRETWWQFLELKFGFSDAQIRPYTFQMAPFIADKASVQQGYLSSEPYILEKEGVKTVVHLLADAGWPSYSAMISTRKKIVDEDPNLVQRFVDASIEGWYSYLYGDPAPGNALIKEHNPEMTDDVIANGIAKMKEYGIVDSGDALKDGVGALNEARLGEFFALMSGAGMYPKDMAYMKAFDLRFANKRVGMQLKN